MISAGVILSAILSLFKIVPYRDSDWATTQYLGQDTVSLIIVLPLLLWSHLHYFTKKRGVFILTLAAIYFYFFYTYSFYVFVTKFTILYFFNLSVFSLSFFSLLAAFILILRQEWHVGTSKRISQFLAVIYLLAIAFILSFLWLFDLVNHIINPNYLSDTPDGEAPLIIYSLDLGIVIPFMVLSVIWILQQKL